MSAFLQSQLDYIFFFYGLAFLLLVPICLFLRRRPYPQLAWSWLVWFGAAHGENEWLDLLALSLGSSFVFDFARLGLLIISFACLTEFGRASLATSRSHRPGRWILIAMIGLATLGGLAGLAGLFAATRYVLGFGGGLWAAGALFLGARKTTIGFRPLRTAALGMMGYALAAGVVVNPAPFPPASLVNYDSFLAATGFPIQLIRGLLSLWICASLCFFARASLDEERDHHFRAWFSKLMRGAVAGVLLLLIGGWLITQYFGNVASREIRDDYGDEARVLQQLMLDKMEETNRLVNIISESPAIILASLSRTPETIQQANSILNRCGNQIPGSICYLMDSNGLTIASSNRHYPDSFVGKSYASRPYFTQAIEGSSGRYWALGATSKKIGFYGSSPVRDNAGQIVGVAVIKRSMNDIETVIPKHSLGLVIDQHGIVVMSNLPHMVLKSLRPLSARSKEELLASRQFGEGPFTPILTQELVDGGECLLQGNRLLVVRHPLPWEGWSIVFFGSMRPIVQARLLGISITLLFCLLFIGFIIIITIIIESSSRITKESLKKRNLERFLSPQVVDLIGQDEGEISLKSERLQATILFSDIQGFTELSERLDPQETADLLTGYFSFMSKIIFAHDGTLDKYLGDGLIAIFGAPFEYPDHPLKAVQAGLQMLEQQQKFVAGLANEKRFSIRIGIDTGEIIAGFQGSPERMEYTALGKSVIIANRLQSLAEQGTLYLGRATYEAVKHVYAAEFVGKIRLPKGTEEVEIYRLDPGSYRTS